tara:strand:- start:86 stop:268 length:183 start_codon:yes stop_codon:yes gene_type:complete
MSRRKTKINKSQKDQLDLYKDYEPDGRDLAEWLESSEKTDPNYDPADHWASIETDIRIGK